MAPHSSIRGDANDTPMHPTASARLHHKCPARQQRQQLARGRGDSQAYKPKHTNMLTIGAEVQGVSPLKPTVLPLSSGLQALHCTPPPPPPPPRQPACSPADISLSQPPAATGAFPLSQVPHAAACSPIAGHQPCGLALLSPSRHHTSLVPPWPPHQHNHTQLPPIHRCEPQLFSTTTIYAFGTEGREGAPPFEASSPPPPPSCQPSPLPPSFRPPASHLTPPPTHGWRDRSGTSPSQTAHARAHGCSWHRWLPAQPPRPPWLQLQLMP